MVTVTIYGLDQFVVGDLSRDMTSLLAKNYEIDEDEVNFIAPNAMVFHNGAEQTSWNVTVHVNAPLKVKVLEEQASRIIIELIKGLGIHVSVEFYYYSQDNRYTYVNPDYPRFIDADPESDYENYESEELEEGEGEDQIYTGDIFEEHNNDHCDCGCDDHDHDDCECGCNHKHTKH